ncbi:MAG: PASTA domain-containing protein [Prolixibacteraceae bacterium]|nr:PASTA domain-containing protein [Prolixibacteraceae bacterium]MBN2774329.1 PASTA domain-containing protein [Prolixibacteraceae bacterium]
MSLKKFLLSRDFLKNLIIAVGILILLITFTMIGIRIYTHHGQGYLVPDLIGLQENEIAEKVHSAKLNFEITDSVYIGTQTPGSVIDQVPKPGFEVKQGRTILLTINAMAPEKVILPKLRYISFRQAQAVIENIGLQLGEITYRPSEFNTLVLNAISDSVEVFEGDELNKGAIIDLVVGKGSGFEKIPLPDLKGLSIEDAKILIKDAMLNQGVIIYDETIVTSRDSANARLWKQLPDPEITPMIEPGISVDMWVTVDEEKLRKAIEN